MIEDTCGGLLGRHRALNTDTSARLRSKTRSTRTMHRVNRTHRCASVHRKGLVDVDQDAEVFISGCRTSVFQPLSWFYKFLHLR